MFLVFLGLILVSSLCFLDWILQNKNNFSNQIDNKLKEAEAEEYIKQMALEISYKNKTFLKKNFKDRRIWIKAVEKKLRDALKRSKEDIGIKPFCYSLALMEITDRAQTGNKIKPFNRTSSRDRNLLNQFISRISHILSFGKELLTHPKKLANAIFLLFGLGYFAICFVPILLMGFFYNFFFGIIWLIIISFIFIMIAFAINNKNSET